MFSRSFVRATRPLRQSQWDSAISNLRLMSVRRGLTSDSGFEFDPPSDADFDDMESSSGRAVSDMVYKNAISIVKNADPKLSALARPHAEELLDTHGIDALAAALYCIAHPKSEYHDTWGRGGGSGERTSNRRFNDRRFSADGGFAGRRYSADDRYGGDRRQNRGGFDRDRRNSDLRPKPKY